MSSSDNVQLPETAGFWIRLLAHITDGIAFSAVVTTLGLLLTAVAPSTFGLSGALLEQRTCRPLPFLPASIPPPADLRPNLIPHCKKSFLGYDFRNGVIAAEQRRQPSSTVTVSRTYVTDKGLNELKTFDVDGPLYILFLVYVVVAQGLYGATLGKWALRLRVVGAGGRPPGVWAPLVRDLVLSIPGLGALLCAALVLLGGAPTSLLLTAGLLLLGGMAALGAEIWWTATHGPSSIHDRIAGTRVIGIARG